MFVVCYIFAWYFKGSFKILEKMSRMPYFQQQIANAEKVKGNPFYEQLARALVNNISSCCLLFVNLRNVNF